jgi:hypothetical protein
MDRKAIVYGMMGILFLGGFLFRDQITVALSESGIIESPRASLQRPGSVKSLSPLEKVLISLQSSGIPANVDGSQTDSPAPLSDDSSAEEVAPAVLTFAVDKVKTNKRNSRIAVRGIARGDSILKIEVYRDGKFLYDILKGNSNPKKTQFSFKEDYGLGVYKIRVVGSEGMIVDKWYRFVPWIGGPVDTAPFHTRIYRSKGVSDWTSY